MATEATKLTMVEAAAPATPAAGHVVVYAKADGKLYQKDDAGTETDLAAAASGGSSLTAALGIQTSGANYTTTSGTYADIDGTNLTATLTTGAHRCKVTFSAFMSIASVNTINIDVLVDGTGIGGNGAWQYRGHASGFEVVTFIYVTPALTAASHTLKPQWKVNGDTGTISRSAGPPCFFLVEELPV